MDSFREKQNKNCSVGGLHCTCCNSFKSKRNGKNKRIKPKLNRIVRSEMKVETQDIIKEEL
jgi:hypothetical protein